MPSLIALYLAMGLAYLWWLGATTYPLLVAFAIFYGTAYGGSPSAISMRVMPSDQMSASSLYWPSWMTSGAIQ